MKETMKIMVIVIILVSVFAEMVMAGGGRRRRRKPKSGYRCMTNNLPYQGAKYLCDDLYLNVYGVDFLVHNGYFGLLLRVDPQNTGTGRLFAAA